MFTSYMTESENFRPAIHYQSNKTDAYVEKVSLFSDIVAYTRSKQNLQSLKIEGVRYLTIHSL